MPPVKSKEGDRASISGQTAKPRNLRVWMVNFAIGKLGIKFKSRDPTWVYAWLVNEQTVGAELCLVTSRIKSKSQEIVVAVYAVDAHPVDMETTSKTDRFFTMAIF